MATSRCLTGPHSTSVGRPHDDSRITLFCNAYRSHHMDRAVRAALDCRTVSNEFGKSEAVPNEIFSGKAASLCPRYVTTYHHQLWKDDVALLI